MSRPRRPPDPILMATHTRLLSLFPEHRVARLRLRQLDGPPGAPRFVAQASLCPGVSTCARHTPDSGQCAILDCPQRKCLRLLLSREGQIMQIIHQAQGKIGDIKAICQRCDPLP